MVGVAAEAKAVMSARRIELVIPGLGQRLKEMRPVVGGGRDDDVAQARGRRRMRINRVDLAVFDLDQIDVVADVESKTAAPIARKHPELRIFA